MIAQYFPLETAYLCENCGMVGNSAVSCSCCACATALLGLAAVLNRETRKEAARDCISRAALQRSGLSIREWKFEYAATADADIPR